MQTESVVRLQKELEKGSALLVASVPGRFYLTGFETSDGYVLITPENAYFLMKLTLSGMVMLFRL